MESKNNIDLLINSTQLRDISNIHLEHFDEGKLLSWVNQEKRKDIAEVKIKLLSNLQYISNEEFAEKLLTMKHSEDNSPYALILDNEVGRSKYWVYTLVKDSLPMKPCAFLYADSDHLPLNVSTIQTQNISHFRLLDDCAYSGRQAENLVSQMILESVMANELHPIVNIVIPYISTIASERLYDLKRIKVNGVRPIININDNAEHIASIREILTPQEIEILHSVSENFGSDVYLNSTLTYFEHKIPDSWSFALDIKDCMKKKDSAYKINQAHLEGERVKFNR